MSIQKLSSVIATIYENFPKGRFITLVVLRTTHSETIFRTEGSGEPMCSEFVQAGLEGENQKTIIQRLVMTKRKQVAPERRYGREHLRAHELLYTNIKDGSLCSLNTNAPCEMCTDCFLYGFAAGGGGAQKSRIWTEDAFSILPASDVVGDRTINAIYETGTMRDEKGNPSTALNTSEYIKPGVHFLDVVTLKDVTADELRYIIGNILFTSRYGAVSSRVGRMENQILGVFGSITELPSSLELVQATYDVLGKPLEHPLNINQLITASKQVIANWQNKRGVSVHLSEAEVTNLLTDVETNWSEAERDNFLKRLSQSYEPFRQVATEKKKAKAKGKNTLVEVES
ncbi:type I-D CRISPR-associated protein Cas7/Csc2 [Nostoc sp. 'Lobaria pulmonaria (5183) cyanobiont']|uniref:type I-D CRISPR-associated protein Cas7/Csc2 n=1 Tax=Nostoc sp. 'Lobaria pulmonaria (5183) cyanobiont' TaxID=1618022 RepID=UPI000CF3296B|nr:type I-D CRISPR-associated protein Cas7/Csc2 [Nostoc sp. 'Lobaria pulmonaria (5183) cyanobiont']AVH69594.1 CRISPR-associated protein Csc2 [Nostoc sp. 'Lobaria pulmonaria (5183) cyanobiont']